MDQNNQPIVTNPVVNPAPTSPAPAGSTPTPGHDKKVGPIVATLIIVLVLIIAALYLFASRINQTNTSGNNPVAMPEQNTTPFNSPTVTNTPAVAPVTNQATDVNSLQNDLNVSTGNLDTQNF